METKELILEEISIVGGEFTGQITANVAFTGQITSAITINLPSLPVF